MSSPPDDEITLTLTTLSGQTDNIVISKTRTTLHELSELASALLGVDAAAVTLTVDGREIYSAGASGASDGTTTAKKVGENGVKNGDVVLVGQGRNGAGAQQVQQVQQGQSAGAAAGPISGRVPLMAPPRPPSAQTAGGGSGQQLDFSSLLGTAAAAASAPAAPAAAAPAAAAGGGGGGLNFNIPALESAALQATLTSSSHPVEWDGMSLDDAVRSNPNPAHLVPILLSPAHPNLMKELNYHSPALAAKVKEAASSKGGLEEATKVWREELMKGGIEGALRETTTKRREREMSDRLRSNPNDAEAKKYFADKDRKRDVDMQYRQMMEEYPESMGRVLMLYIDAEVNGHPIQAFVDSGAQSTIMSSACAERCGLLHLLDRRFEGTAVGVGTGKILGRVHITPLKIRGHYFPCTITVMDSEEGLGDKNMDFLFGLDMLKRHRCRIDLMTNALVFALPDGRTMEAPFLHEKDLDEKKGGTKGFDADRANAELAKRMEEDNAAAAARGTGGGGPTRDDEESGYEGGESEAMDVEEVQHQGEGGTTRKDNNGKVAKKKG